jgi:hypothetical protein
MVLGTFAPGTDAFVINGVLPKVGASLGVSLGVAGFLVTVFSGVYAVSAPVLAVATGGMGRKKAMVIAWPCSPWRTCWPRWRRTLHALGDGRGEFAGTPVGTGARWPRCWAG